MIYALKKELKDIQSILKQEKQKLDEVEKVEERLDNERAKLLSELEQLEEEIEILEQKNCSQSSDGQVTFLEEDDDLLIQKLEQESQYLSKLLLSSEEEQQKTSEEVKKSQTQNQILEIENANLEKKVKSIIPLDDELQRLQSELSSNLDEEKKLFEENLKMLQALKEIELADQEVQNTLQQKQQLLDIMSEQLGVERKVRSFEYHKFELKEKLDSKARTFTQLKWKFDKACLSLTDTDTKKVIGFDAFKQKVERFSIELNQLEGMMERLITQKQVLDSQIATKDLKNANKQDVANYYKGFKEVETEMESLLARENDQLDFNRLQKSYYDLLRDTETEFLRKAKTINHETSNKLLSLIQENVFSDVKKLEKEEIKSQIKAILYEIEEYDVQKELNIDLQVAMLKSERSDIIFVNKEIKFFFQLEFIEQYKKLQARQETKAQIQGKLKRIGENINEVDKLLQNNSNNLDNLQKEASYLKESEFSPVKGRASIVYGVKGDLEKENEIQSQFKQLEQQSASLEHQKQERDKLKKMLKQYQQKFNDLDLENSSLIKLEELIDEVNTDLDYKAEELKSQVKAQLENDLKQMQKQVQDRVERFQQKRQVLTECRSEEKDKRQDILKVDNQATKVQHKIEKMEKSIKAYTVGASLPAEKQESLNQFIKDMEIKKRQMQTLVSELDAQKFQIHQVAQELNQIGDKIIPLEQLNNILGQLKEMNSLKKIQDQIRELSEDLNQKEVMMEQQLSEMLGGSLFTCETQFKHAEALLDQLSKKILNFNNSLNDFEIDLKKGLHLNPSDETVQIEGKKLQDENSNDRKDLKNQDEQKNMTRKVLHKIKSCLKEQETLKKSSSQAQSKLTPQVIDEFINEIQTCIEKMTLQQQEIAKMESVMGQRRDKWAKLMFRASAKEALMDDIDKAIKDNQQSLELLSAKIQQIKQQMAGLEAISEAMNKNGDYDLRRASIQKLNNFLNEFKQKQQELEKNKALIEQNLQALKAGKDKNLRNLSVDQLQELAKTGEETQDCLSKEHKKADLLLKELMKKRVKLGDADINENFKLRQNQLIKLDEQSKMIESDFNELDKILQESQKINPSNSQVSLKQFNDLKRDILKKGQDLSALKSLFNQLKEKIRQKDFSREDPQALIPLLNELQALKQALEQKEIEFNTIQKNIKFLKNKHGGFDIEQKLQDLSFKNQNLSERLNQLLEDQMILKELYEEFDGYTSDVGEEDFIDRLGIEVKEIQTKHNQATQLNEKLMDKILVAQKDLTRQKENEVKAVEMEKRAQLLSEIEEEALLNERLVDEITYKIGRNKKVFMGMNAREKLQRREQECLELSKRLVQFDNQVNDIDSEIQQELSLLKQSPQTDGEVISALEKIVQQMNQIKQDYQKPGTHLRQIYEQLEKLKSQNDIHQFDLLRANIRIKKQILDNLSLIKSIRVQFNQLKVQFENNKTKKQIAYKPMKGDYVDQLLADWINNNNCPVPISRLGNGFYMFGSKKIFAKIMNGKLLIRVGGGYMGIDEFMFYYGAQELNKMLAYEDFEGDEELDLDKVVDVDGKNDLIKQFGDGKSIIGAQQFKKRLSPRPQGGSPRPGSPKQPAGKRSSQNAASPRGGFPAGRVSPRGQRLETNSSGSSQNISQYQGSFLKQGASKVTDQSK